MVWEQYDYEQCYNTTSDPYEAHDIINTTQVQLILPALRKRMKELKTLAGQYAPSATIDEYEYQNETNELLTN